MEERQKTKLFTDDSEVVVWQNFNNWLQNAEPIPVVNHWLLTQLTNGNIVLAIIYSEKPEIVEP